MELRSLWGILSQFYHLVALPSRKQGVRLRRGALIISIDVDVGCKFVGEKNRGLNDLHVNDHLSESAVGEIEEMAIPYILNILEDFEVPVTFAIRGQLTETDSSLIDLIKQSSVKHDIGAHGYSHHIFTSLSHSEAKNEFEMISVGMKKFNVEPKSFVFPKNKVAHLDLLERYGYKCYRGCGDFRYDGMYIHKHGNLFDVHPSYYLGSSPYSICINRMIDIAIKYRTPFHIWFHAFDFGSTVQSIQRKIVRTLQPILRYAHGRNQKGELTLETMYSVVKKLGSCRDTKSEERL
jgi:peptidoglycan/xylan/chitin deacetylase (PgdA/CDA1 family)